METIFLNKENSKTSELHKFVHNLLQKLDLKRNKHVKQTCFSSKPVSICYTWKHIRQHYKNNKIGIIVPAWNNEFELPDGSYSMFDIQDYIECIIKKT